MKKGLHLSDEFLDERLNQVDSSTTILLEAIFSCFVLLKSILRILFRRKFKNEITRNISVKPIIIYEANKPDNHSKSILRPIILDLIYHLIIWQ